MHMPYNDALGVVLDKLSHDDLTTMATGPLQMPVRSIRSHNVQELRLLCSKRLRRAAGHSMMNLLRGDHSLPYETIVRDVARELSVGETGDDVLMLEHHILSKFITTMWNAMTPAEQEQVVADLQVELMATKMIRVSNMASKVKAAAPVLLQASCRTAAFSTVSLAAVSAGPLVTTFGNVMGWNVLQTIIFRTVLRRAGLMAAAKATMGYGLAGTAISAAAWVGPVAWGLTGVWMVHQMSKPSLRLTGPTVAFVAMKRAELFA
jgi:uncharacterized protein YaaW (UPF0174 family)